MLCHIVNSPHVHAEQVATVVVVAALVWILNKAVNRWGAK